MDIAKPSALDFLLRNCWELFFPYLSNQEIGKIDLVLTDIKLRRIYLNKVSDFYLTNKIYSFKELQWIFARNMSLTKCHLDFNRPVGEGKVNNS